MKKYIHEPFGILLDESAKKFHLVVLEKGDWRKLETQSYPLDRTALIEEITKNIMGGHRTNLWMYGWIGLCFFEPTKFQELLDKVTASVSPL
jgi:hypothetical protein